MSKALFKPGIQITELSLVGVRMSVCHQVVTEDACVDIPCQECLLGHENATKENILQFVAPEVLERFTKPRFQVDLEKYTKLIRDNEESFKKAFTIPTSEVIDQVRFGVKYVHVVRLSRSYSSRHLKEVLEWADKQ